MPVINIKNFDIVNMTMKDLATRSTGFKSIPVRYAGNILRVQTPKMEQIFDISDPPASDSATTNYGLNLSFRGEDSDTKIEEFRNAMVSVDEFNMDYATKNSKELFGKAYSKELVEEFHKPIVKFSQKLMKEGTAYPPTMKVKLRFRSNRPEFEVYDQDKKQLPALNVETGEADLEMYQPRTKMINLLEYGGMWVVGKSFGATWRVVQSRVYNDGVFKGCAIVDSDDDSDDDGEPASSVLSDDSDF